MLGGQRARSFVIGRLIFIVDTGRGGHDQASILEVRVGPFQSTMSPNSKRIEELESQFESKNSGFEPAMANLKSAEHHLRFAKETAGLMLEQARNQELQMPKVKAARAAAQVAQTDAESSVQSLTESELALQGEVSKLTCNVGEA